MKRKGVKKQAIEALVPEQLAMEVKLLLTDPVHGRVTYGAMSSLIESLLTKWLEERKQLSRKKELAHV